MKPCECGHSAGSHNRLRFNCLATADGTHKTRCQCKKYEAKKEFREIDDAKGSGHPADLAFSFTNQ